MRKLNVVDPTQNDGKAVPRPRAPKGDLEKQRLEAALEYLLISHLNAQTPPDTGAPSNKRLIDLFLTLLMALKPKIFLDIGANDGSMAAKVKAFLPDCAVTAFEANPAIHAMYNPILSSLGVETLNMAVSAETGEATIFAPRTLSHAYVGGEIVKAASVEPVNTGKSSLLKRNEAATYDEHVVAAITIDDILASKEPMSTQRDVALWIDVEGAAFEVLSGAKMALDRTAIIFIESENHPFWTDQKQCADVARVMIKAGFLPLQRDREYDDKQFNTVFIHHSLIELVYPKTYMLDGRRRERVAGPEAPIMKAATPAPVKRSYHSLAACLMAEVPVFVPVFNNPTYADNMLRQLKGFGIRNIFLVDNASSTDGMAAFLDRAESDATIIRLTQNKGPHDLFVCDTNYACLPDIFCVTDPDLEFRPDMPPDFIFDLLNLTNKYELGKAGLALDLADRDRMNEEKFLFGDHYYHIWEWEGQFWRDRVEMLPDGSPVFRANIDTTFALYNKRFFKRDRFYDAVRVAGHYTCRHLPWYKDSGLPAQEEAAYRATQKYSYHMR